MVVHLLANGVDTGQTKEVSQTDNWTYRFENLPKYQNG
nr:Cna B-type domain-containing protein [Streptococcus lutetiensis]